MIFGFDVISDLNLTSTDEFNWEGKPTSLFCLVAGNISSDTKTLVRTLQHLSKCYKGVFYIDGALENPDINFRETRINELTKLCSGMENVIYMHNNVVVVDGIALVGINGWYGNYDIISDADRFQAKCNRYEDAVYLERTLERLQLHVDVKKIIVISNCVPTKELYYGEDKLDDDISPHDVLHVDTEQKIIKWVFGTHKKIVDAQIKYINYLNNPKYDRDPYYAKRIEVDL